ncbi:MAG: IS1380 family transposase [Gemmatimonadetes bacterium]|nr:IS1380 family transposase [Gemmatimonadota bacterium]
MRRPVKADLPIAFVPQALTSYGGLELLRRYVCRLDLPRRLRARLAGVAGDYGAHRLVLLVLGLLYSGARRVEHLRYVVGDPLLARFCGLARLPAARTLANWLKRFTRREVAALQALNTELVTEEVARLALPRLTLDVDGTVVRTGPQVAWAFRGFNPHHRKDPSYYPLLAHVAQTGHILRLTNRPGNVHDSRGAVRFLRGLLTDLRARFGRRLPLEVRLDAAFFQEEMLKLLARQGVGYAVKVGFWHWLGLRALVAERQRWRRVRPDVAAFEVRLPVEQWGLRLRVVIYRKRVAHRTRKNFQLDLFSPDDGHFEYSAVATNLQLRPRALWYFMAGRGAQEKTLAELKGEFALDVVPTNHYGANSAWQQLSILAYNVSRGFQLATLATSKPGTRKRTFRFLLRSMRTLRFLVVARAGRLTRISGRQVLRLAANPATERLYTQITERLAA